MREGRLTARGCNAHADVCRTFKSAVGGRGAATVITIRESDILGQLNVTAFAGSGSLGTVPGLGTNSSSVYDCMRASLGTTISVQNEPLVPLTYRDQ